jgi:hypothetical protein
MALTREYPPFEDPGGRKSTALRMAGFLYDANLHVFAYRAAGKVALEVAVEGRPLAQLKRFLDEAPPIPGQYRFFDDDRARISLAARRSFLIGLGWTN